MGSEKKKKMSTVMQGAQGVSSTYTIHAVLFLRYRVLQKRKKKVNVLQKM